MKKFMLITVVVLLVLVFVPVAVSAGPPPRCTTIQSGNLYSSTGDLITTGFDDWGYNYQAHLFNGLYCEYDRDADDCATYEGITLEMKWNDAWLSNQDCDGDGLLDRHYDYPGYIGSGAWVTNHQAGEYELDGQTCHWTYFVKIVAAPADAHVDGDGNWVGADDVVIGPSIWGAFAIIQQVENDPCAGLHGLQYSSPDHNGLGNW